MNLIELKVKLTKNRIKTKIKCTKNNNQLNKNQIQTQTKWINENQSKLIE